MKINRKLLAVMAVFAAVPALVATSGFGPKSKNPHAAHLDQMRSEEEQNSGWKNLKVLPQDITRDSLELLMFNYSNALSVGCDHCHVPQSDNPGRLDFAADGKIEKEIARGMIVMTNEINEHYFLTHFPEPKPDQVFVVDCVMCHRGVANPEIYLGKMQSMYKTYDRESDHRKEKILEQMMKEE